MHRSASFDRHCSAREHMRQFCLMSEHKGPLLVGRRGFLSNAATSAAAIAASVPAALAAAQATPPKEPASSANAEVQTTERPGADFMIDVFKSLGFDYVC